MNRAPMPPCNCAPSPRQIHGNTDYGTIFPIRAHSFAGIPALLHRVAGGRGTVMCLLSHFSSSFSLKTVLTLSFLLTSLHSTKTFSSF